jgi:hypothetical protein
MKSIARFRERQGRCFELSGLVMLREPDNALMLVHGYRVSYAGIKIGHAWIELADGRVYDPVEDRYYEPGRYGGVAVIRYSKREAAKLLAQHGHYGPWSAEVESI